MIPLSVVVTGELLPTTFGPVRDLSGHGPDVAGDALSDDRATSRAEPQSCMILVVSRGGRALSDNSRDYANPDQDHQHLKEVSNVQIV